MRIFAFAFAVLAAMEVRGHPYPQLRGTSYQRLRLGAVTFPSDSSGPLNRTTRADVTFACSVDDECDAKCRRLDYIAGRCVGKTCRCHSDTGRAIADCEEIAPVGAVTDAEKNKACRVHCQLIDSRNTEGECVGGMCRCRLGSSDRQIGQKSVESEQRETGRRQGLVSRVEERMESERPGMEAVILSRERSVRKVSRSGQASTEQVRSQESRHREPRLDKSITVEVRRRKGEDIAAERPTVREEKVISITTRKNRKESPKESVLEKEEIGAAGKREENRQQREVSATQVEIRRQVSRNESLRERQRTLSEDESLTKGRRTSQDESLMERRHTSKDDESVTKRKQTLKDGSVTEREQTGRNESLTERRQTTRDYELVTKRRPSSRDESLTERQQSMKGDELVTKNQEITIDESLTERQPTLNDDEIMKERRQTARNNESLGKRQQTRGESLTKRQQTLNEDVVMTERRQATRNDESLARRQQTVKDESLTEKKQSTRDDDLLAKNQEITRNESLTKRGQTTRNDESLTEKQRTLTEDESLTERRKAMKDDDSSTEKQQLRNTKPLRESNNGESQVPRRVVTGKRVIVDDAQGQAAKSESTSRREGERTTYDEREDATLEEVIQSEVRKTDDSQFLPDEKSRGETSVRERQTITTSKKSRTEGHQQTDERASSEIGASEADQGLTNESSTREVSERSNE